MKHSLHFIEYTASWIMPFQLTAEFSENKLHVLVRAFLLFEICAQTLENNYYSCMKISTIFLTVTKRTAGRMRLET